MIRNTPTLRVFSFLKLRDLARKEKSDGKCVDVVDGAGAPIVLAAAFVVVFMRRRRLTSTEKTRQSERIDELYEDTPEQHREAERQAEAEEPAIRRDDARVN